MKKGLIIVMAMAFCAMVLWTASAFAEVKCNRGYVEDALANNMTYEAEECLNVMLRTDPANGWAQCKAGEMDFDRNNYVGAGKHFTAESAKKYCPNKLAELYLGREMYDQAFRLDPSKRAEHANRFLAECKADRDDMCSLAAQYGKAKEAAAYADVQAEKYGMDTPEGSAWAQRALNYEQSMERLARTNANYEESGRRFKAQYLEEARIPDDYQNNPVHQQNADALWENADHYFTLAGQPDRMETEAPRERIYGPSPEKYRFPLKAGEQTDHWITGQNGRNNKYEFFTADSCDFDILYDDGSVTKKGERPTSIRMKTVFKLRAKTDCLRGGGIGLLIR